MNDLKAVDDAKAEVLKANSVNNDDKSTFPNENTRNITNLAKFEYKSNTFLLAKFALIVFTLLSIQYHNENFNIQMRIARDVCPATLTNSNVTSFTLPNPEMIDQIDSELSFIESIQKDQVSNDYTFKYLTYADCMRQNFSQFINSITVRPIVDTNKQGKVSNMTIIVICSDDAYLRFVEKRVSSVTRISTHLKDKIDFQTNILDQLKASCRLTSPQSSTITYAQLIYSSGQILGAILLSICADLIGRKKVYLGSMYVSTIIGVLVSIVQTYKQFIIIRLPIAALIQGAYIASFVLLFELVMKSNHRVVYCCLYLSIQYISNTLIACLSLLIKDWRYMQLTGSLLSSVAILYPWILQDSLKFMISKRKFFEADKLWSKYLSNDKAIGQLIRFKTDDKLNEEFKQSSWWPILIWQSQFRKIILIFLLMWSILSLSNFFVNEDEWNVFDESAYDYILVNLVNAIFHMLMIIVCLKFGKRFPLGSCMLLGGLLYLMLNVISTSSNKSWWRLVLHFFTKCLLNFSLNLLLLYVCELFPCDIKCSSLGFFLSIKYLSEMFATYIFKISSINSIIMIKIGLAVFCILLCACGLLLPDKNLFPFNMDYIDFVNSLNEFIEYVPKQLKFDYVTTRQRVDSIEPQVVIESNNLEEHAVVSYAANDLITKINSENHSKNGKINPLYEEEHQNSSSSYDQKSISIEKKIQINFIDVSNFADVSTKF